MGLETNSGSLLYLNIKNGKITYKKDDEKKETDAVSGIITAIKFEEKEYEGNKYEQLALTIMDNGEKFILQIGTDSGYFTAFCNALRTGDTSKKVKITPWLKTEKGKKKSGCFVDQNDKALKWYSTKDKPMDVPPMESTHFDDKVLWSSKKKVAYWKNWLLSIKWEHEIVAGSLSTTSNAVKDEIISEINNTPNDNDSLPF
jgi:hypothetical protein